MKILVSMKIANHSAYPEVQDVISHDLILFLEKYNITPILVPNRIFSLQNFLDIINPNGIILSGGNDISYTTVKSDPMNFRNNTENLLIKFSLSKKLPLMGICRGFQMLNIHFGGSIQPINSGNHAGCFHKVSTSFINELDLSEFNVNSYHNYGVKNADLAPELKILASSNDDWIEAFEHKMLPIIGIQWHPERANYDAKILDDALMKRWMELCTLKLGFAHDQ